MIEYHDDIAEIDGISFRKDKKSGYYLSSKAIHGKRTRLHIYIWEKYNVTRKCECCGNEFSTNKYSKARYCEKHRGKSSHTSRESRCV